MIVIFVKAHWVKSIYQLNNPKLHHYQTREMHSATVFCAHISHYFFFFFLFSIVYMYISNLKKNPMSKSHLHHQASLLVFVFFEGSMSSFVNADHAQHDSTGERDRS